MPQDIQSMDENGTNIQIMGIEGLKGQYVINMLDEFESNSLKAFEKNPWVKAKDLMRLDKLDKLGFGPMLNGAIKLIE